MPIRIVARFIGKDASLGYKNKHTYRLWLNGNEIMREDHSGVCPYDSIQAFLKNWDQIVVEDW